MALNPPGYAQSGTYTALLDRHYVTTSRMLRSTADETRARSGILPGPINRSAAMSSSLWSITIGPYSAVISNAYASNAGDYQVTNTVNEVLTVAASSPTTSRIDIVGIYVQDPFYSGSVLSGGCVVIQGTPSAGTPSAPTVPSTFLPLYQGLIAANSTTPVWTDVRKRTAIAGAVCPIFANQLTDVGSYPGEVQLVPANGGAPERLRRWHSDGRWRGMEEFTVNTGAVANPDTSIFTSPVAPLSFAVPDPGYNYRLRVYGGFRFSLGTNTAVEVTLRDGSTTGTSLTETYNINGRSTGNQVGASGDRLTFDYSKLTTALNGPHTVYVTVTKYIGGGGDGWAMSNESWSRLYADVVPV